MHTTIKLLEEYQVQYVYRRFGFPFTKNSTSKFVIFGLYYRIVLMSGQFATRFYFCKGTWWRKYNNPESRQLLLEIEKLSPFL